MDLKTIQRWAARYRRHITFLFKIWYVFLIALWLFGYWSFTQDARAFFWMYNLGKIMGQAAVAFYILSLIPGILKRLKIIPLLPIQATLMLFRRQFGVSMFLLAINHMGYTTTISLLATSSLSLNLFTTHQIIGLLAVLLLFPLWLTSNDFSQRRLGKWWRWLHRLTYLALVAIFVHVALVSLWWSLVLAAVLALEILSWVLAWNRQQQPVKVPS